MQRASEGNCGHVRSVALPRARRNAALQAAEARCVAAGEVWSTSRRRTYELPLETLRPCAAYDLIARFDSGGQPPGPPTIYRALDFLMRLGLVHRIKSEEKFIA